MTVQLTRLRWWHIGEVMVLEEDLFGPEKWSPSMFWNELANHHHYLVALDDDETGDADGRVAGYAGLAVSGPDESWVQNIAVRRDAQRRGIGRLLLEALLAEAARRGAASVLLEVRADNDPARCLYAACGFERIAVRRRYYQPGDVDALVLRRRLR